MIKPRPLHRQQQGFTIIELIIATAVLSVMLVLVTVLMINIGNLYYKGINQARVQDSVRNINDTIGGQLKLSDKVPSQAVSADGNTHAYCIGSKRFTYVLGVQVGHQALDASGHPTGSTYQHVLWEDTNPSPGTCFINAPSGPNPGTSSPVDLTQNPASSQPDGTEMIAPNSRLTAFCIGAFTVPSSCSAPVNAPPAGSSKPTYMLTIAEASGDSDLLTNTSPLAQNYNTVCVGGKGDQFCATARLQTSIVPRQ